MKEHVQDYGVRKWAGDDLIELQSEPLSALQALVAPYAPCILQGCELETIPDGNGEGSPAYRLHAGYVALKGRKTVDNGAGTDTDTGTGGTGDGAETAAATADNGETTAAEEYVKIVRVTAQTVHQPTVFLTLGCTPLSRAYGNGENKAIAYDYTAEVCDVLSEVGDRPYLELVADADNPRLPDTLGITQKLDRDGEANDVVVGFTLPSVRLPLFSGLKLGTLFGQIQRWLKDLRALAFKDKVAKTDLDADLQGELDGKVAQEKGMGLSEANFTKEEKLKLDGIKPNANNYVHPTSAGNKHIPTGGKSGMYLKWSASGTATWAKPSASEIEAAPASHTHTPSDIGAAPASHTHAPSDIGAASTAVASATSAGLMPAADKKKLDNIADVTITISGTQLKFTWTPPNTRYPCTATLSAGGPSVSGGTTA